MLREGGLIIMWLFFVIFLIFAVLQLIFPAEMLMFGRRWQFKEGVEPSEAAIVMARISAIIGLAVIIIAMFSSCGAM
jgi:archaellum biogenesis protein FlaJ (TadC family)